ncbi:MAG TPA: carboxypeptidase-like regulatory domain-containing protein, partial [Myxococcota bacterium]|nr:carboxypeptidase-like regulatory domain-containing protein [Myxococcota bacterium]
LPHLSTWTAADAVDRVTVQGSVRYADGTPAVGASVTVTGAGYGWSSTVATDGSAAWSTWAKLGEPLEVTADLWAGGWYYAAQPVAVDGAQVVEPTVVDVQVEIDPSRGCDPDGGEVSDTLHLTLDEAGGSLHHVWALSLASCGWYEPLEVWPFFSSDLVFYTYHQGEAHELRLDGPWLYDGVPPARVAAWGVQPLGAAFDDVSVLPATGYRREHLGLPVDWQFVLPTSGGGGTWAVRTRAGLFGKLEVTRVTPVAEGFDVDLRWRVQTDGRNVLDP